MHGAFEILKEKPAMGGEGNCCPAKDLIFVTGTGMPLKQRVVKREFRKLLTKTGIRSVRLSMICVTPRRRWGSRLEFP